MKKDFLSNIVLLIGINLLVKPLYIFGIDRSVQNVVGLEEYGLYSTILSLALIFNILNDFGIQNFTSRHIAQHGHLIDKYFPNLLTLKLLAAGTYLVIVLIIGWWLGYTRWHFLLIFVLLLNQVIIGLIQFFRANIIGLGQYRTDSLLSVLDRCLMILICGTLLYMPAFRAHFRIEYFVYAHTASLFITLSITFALLRRYLHIVRFRFNWKLLYVLLKQSFPYALIILLTTIYHRSDAIMIEKLYVNGVREVGIYAAAYRLMEAVMMFALLFGNLLLPMFAKLLKAKQSVDALVQLSFQFLLAGAITGGIAISAFRVEIMEFLYTEHVNYSGDVLGLLMLGFIAVSGTYIFGSLIIARGELRRLNQIYVGGILINISLNALFIPKYGAIGAAYTTAITQSAVLVAEMALVYALLHVSLLKSTLRILGFSTLLCTFAYIHSFWNLNWQLGLVLHLLVGGLLALICGLIRLKELKDYVTISS